MQTYIIQYRINGGELRPAGAWRARSPAGAIAQAARTLADITGQLDIIATLDA